MTDTRELVNELRLIGCHANGDARCTCVIGQDAADTITALSERVRRFTAVVEEIASRQTLSGHDGDLDWLIDDARAALTSGGRG